MESTRTGKPVRGRWGGETVWRRLALVGGLFLSGAAGAVGLGEISLLSRIGEPLLAEVPIADGENLTDAACFSLTTPAKSEFPAITQARLRLSQNNQQTRLLIIGKKSLNEPVFTLSLHVGCDIDLQRDYVLMPEAPGEPAAPTESNLPSNEPAAPVEPRKPARHRSRQPAPQTAPADTAAPDAPPPATPVPHDPAFATALAPRPRTKHRKPMLDRLVLGNDPDDNPLASPEVQQAAGERLLRLETSLHSLNQQIDTLDASLKLGIETRAAKRELQAAQDSSASAIVAAPPPAPTREQDSWRNWLELMFSTLLGGTLVAGIAAFVEQRRKQAATPASKKPPPAKSKTKKPLPGLATKRAAPRPAAKPGSRSRRSGKR